jgi:tyrosine-protein kinase Etk/Wzc
MEKQSAELQDGVNEVRPDRPAAEGSGMSILEIIALLANRQRLIIIVTLLLMAAAAIVVSFMRDSFKGEAVILPPQQQQSTLAALASGALGDLAGAAVKTPGDLYIGMLKSRSIADGIIARFHLRDVYKQKFASDARIILAKHASFTSAKDSLITISVEDHDPKRAAAMANAFVEGLYDLTSRLALTDASQRRLFFEQELRKGKDGLSDAEIALANVQRSTGLLLPAGQEGVLLGATARLRAEISSREVDLRSMETFATGENPQVQILQREIAAMRTQLSDLETKGAAESNFELSAGKLSNDELGYIRKVRDLKYQEALYELLAKQYEAARLDESKQAPLIQVVDRASVPDRKSGPPRTLIVLGAGFLGFVLSSLYVSITRSVQALCSDPRQAKSLATIRSALWFDYQPNGKAPGRR